MELARESSNHINQQLFIERQLRKESTEDLMRPLIQNSYLTADQFHIQIKLKNAEV